MSSNFTFTDNGIVYDMISLYTRRDFFASGGLYSCGYNTHGGLGDNTITHKSSPVQVGSLTNWKNIVGGNQHTLGIKTDGTLWSWGYNVYGELGLSDIVDRSSPVQIGALTNWNTVSCGTGHSLAIRGDGSAWSWGYNVYGNLGIGSTIAKSSPVQIGSLLNWKQVSGGWWHSHAVKTDGTLWAFGRNNTGQLGVGDIVDRSSPVQVGALTNWKQVSCGHNHTAAVKTDGTLWSWGSDAYGGLGLGDLNVSRSSPVQVGILTNWKSVTCGYGSIVALKTDGTLWACGYNLYGQLGLGDAVNRSSPVQVGISTNWKQVSTSQISTAHTIAIQTNGTLWTWGYNLYGQLGYGDTVNRSSPVQVGLMTNWRQVSNIYNHSIMLQNII